MQFNNPEFKYLLLILIPMLLALYYRERQRTVIPFSGLWFLEGYRSRRNLLKYTADLLRFFAVALLVTALCRPQKVEKKMYSQVQGVDIVLCLDRSGSMQTEDFKPKNRLAVAKNVLADFIDQRDGDRLGLVIFARNSYLQAPLTLDHAIIKKVLEKVELAQGDEDGTALGMGLMNAVSRLRNSTARSKIIIALTDGVNNAGAVDPLTAAKVAATYNIKIYTIGVGTDGIIQMPINHPLFGTILQNVKLEIDEQTLERIADTTNGRYYRATNPDKLRQIYREIDKLEKSSFDQKITNYKEEFFTLVFIALLLLFSELILRNTIFLEVF